MEFHVKGTKLLTVQVASPEAKTATSNEAAKNYLNTKSNIATNVKKCHAKTSPT
jgi:hypothetical protein